MSYKLSDVKDNFGLMPKDDYEIIVEKIEVKEYSTGTQYLNFWLRIRTDVEQAFQNKVQFDKVNQVKESGLFQLDRLSRIFNATNPDAKNKDFESLDLLLDEIVGKKAIAHIDVRHNEFFGEDENYVVFYKPTKFGDKTLDDNEPVEEEKAVIIEVDDLPF